jgi:hypothetical protein
MKHQRLSSTGEKVFQCREQQNYVLELLLSVAMLRWKCKLLLAIGDRQLCVQLNLSRSKV